MLPVDVCPTALAVSRRDNSGQKTHPIKHCWVHNDLMRTAVLWFSRDLVFGKHINLALTFSTLQTQLILAYLKLKGHIVCGWITENQDSPFFPKLWKMSHTKCFVLHQNVVHGWFSKTETSDPISSKITIHKWTNITQENIKKTVYSSCECASGGERHQDRERQTERESGSVCQRFSHSPCLATICPEDWHQCYSAQKGTH